jgi:hypothetical protein
MVMRATIAIIAVILLGSLVGVGISFATPTNRDTVKTDKLVEYQHEGAFDYVVYPEHSYFYDNLLSTEPQPIPANSIEQFNVSFAFQSASTASKGIQVNVILENKGVWKKTVNLVDENSASIRSVSFPLDIRFFQDMADKIDDEIGISSISHDLTLQAVVSNGATSLDGTRVDFVQLLPIQMTNMLIRIGDILTNTHGDTTGQFGYQVQLGENTLYGPITITSPALPASPGDALGPEDIIFFNIIDSMKMTFSYRLLTSSPVSKANTEVKIEAIAANPDKWSKTFVLIPPTLGKEEFAISFPLDVDQFVAVFDAIQEETDLFASSRDLTLVATVHTVAQTEQGQIDEIFTHSIKTDLRGGVMAWTNNDTGVSLGSIDTAELITQPARLWIFSVLGVRIFSASIALVMLAVLGFYLWTYLRLRQDRAALVAERAKEISQKYKSLMVEVNDLPEMKAGETIVPLESLGDLIKVSQGLLKPVHHWYESNKHIYWVYDDSRRYAYHLENGKVPRREKAPAD